MNVSGRSLVYLLVAVTVSVVVFLAVRRTKPVPMNVLMQDEPSALESGNPTTLARVAEPVTVAPAAAALPITDAGSESLADETALMAQIRDLGSKDPLLALTLAREGERRFPGSSEAAERNWVIVKSLDSLSRFEEARAEAQIMLGKYRGTRWAEDVYRHVLLNPPNHPAERGHGKTLELE
jgi:hypothetical protein